VPRDVSRVLEVSVIRTDYRHFSRLAVAILGRHLPLIALGASVGANLVLSNRLLHATKAAPSTLAIGAVVTPFPAVSIRGDGVLVDYESDLPTVLYYFSPSCGWCERNWANVQALANETKGRYRFLAVSSSAVSADFVRERHLTFEVASQVPRDVIARYGFRGTPQTLVVSKDRRVVHAWTGAYTSSQAAEIEAYFNLRLPGLAKLPAATPATQAVAVVGQGPISLSR